MWAESGGGGSNDWPYGLTTDGREMYRSRLLYRFNRRIRSGFSLPNAGDEDAFLVKYDASGNVIWARRAGGTRNDRIMDIVCDAAGNIYACGYFYSDSITFGTTVLTNANPSVGTADLFLCKYTPSRRHGLGCF
jgi:hypothetical protein